MFISHFPPVQMADAPTIGLRAVICLWETIFCIQASRAPKLCLLEVGKKGSQDSQHLASVFQGSQH